MTGEIIKLDNTTLNVENFYRDDVIHGLEKGEIGFLLSIPEMGKSYFCLSVAYEVATGFPLIGVTQTLTSKPRKVLFWSSEDSNQTVLSRIRNHFSEMSPDLSESIKLNLDLLQHEPIGCSYHAPQSRKKEIDGNINSLIELAKNYDCLVIDTLREAVGDADEVQDDITIKIALQKIAKEANVAILVSHHVTKSAGRGDERLSTISGSGFSRTLATARLGFALHFNDKSKSDSKFLSHVKGNNVEQMYRFKKTPIYFSDTSLMSTQKDYLSQWQLHTNIDNDDIDLDEPKEVFLEDSDIQLDEKVEEFSPINDDQLKAYERYLAEKEKNDQNS